MPGKDNIQAKCWNVSSLHPAHQRAVPPNDVVHCFYVFPPSFLSSASFGSLWDAQSCLASFNASCRPNHPKIRRVFYFSLWCLLFVYGPCSTLAHRCDGYSSAPPLLLPHRHLFRLPLGFPSPSFYLERPHNRTADLSYKREGTGHTSRFGSLPYTRTRTNKLVITK